MKLTASLLFLLNLATIGFGWVYYLDTQERIAALEDRVESDRYIATVTTLAPWQVKREIILDKVMTRMLENMEGK